MSRAARGITTSVIILYYFFESFSQELMKAKKEHALQEESDNYQAIRERSRQRDRVFKYYNDFISRTSKLHVLRHVRKQQKRAIENSRVAGNYRKR